MIELWLRVFRGSRMSRLPLLVSQIDTQHLRSDSVWSILWETVKCYEPLTVFSNIFTHAFHQIICSVADFHHCACAEVNPTAGYIFEFQRCCVLCVGGSPSQRIWLHAHCRKDRIVEKTDRVPLSLTAQGCTGKLNIWLIMLLSFLLLCKMYRDAL